MLAGACAQARAEHQAEPAPLAPAVTSATPSPAAAPTRVEPSIDPDALPCPGGVASCDDLHPVVARGVLARAERYLSTCKLCRHRAAVSATRARMRAIVARDERSRRRGEATDCRSSPEVGILVSPESVKLGDRPRVVVASALELEVLVSREGGGAVEQAPERRADGWQIVSLGELPRGAYRVSVRDADRVVSCQRFEVTAERRRRRPSEGVWDSRRGWDGAAERLYSAWIAASFDAPEGTRWKGIAAVLGDRSRNFLHEHLSSGEDADPARLALRPDCADAPFVLRAYFAWKLGLPFGLHRTRAGETEWLTNESAPTEPPLSPSRFGDFANALLGAVTAKSLRAPLADPEADLYPVALEREHLRPGVVFADPYGHTLTLVKWVPQTADKPGQLLAVDAQPDGSVGIRRFWRGNFLWAERQAGQGFGFKTFRPIVREHGEERLLTNPELGVAEGYGGFSLAQLELGPADFYARMARLLTPSPPPPAGELEDRIDALMAQLERRVDEVAVADELVATRKSPIEMPEGRAMFLSTGPWEAASTPCRDLRLLAGLDSVLAFPEEAARAQGDPTGAAALERELSGLLATRAASRFIEYPRSDGTKQRLTLAEIFKRRAGFEIGYNPNDCPELRWGATDGSHEVKTCRRRAPDAQRRQMERMRYWFARRYSCG